MIGEIVSASVGIGTTQAILRVIYPDRLIKTPIRFRFNPTEYQIQKANNFAEINIPGLNAAPIQFVRGGSEKLIADLIADTSDTLDDVRLAYVGPLRDLMTINPEIAAPPIVELLWGSQSFRGVIESLNISYTLFTPEGVPIRAKVNLAMREYREEAFCRPFMQIPGLEMSVYLPRRGDTLASIAGSALGSSTMWRAVAKANAIVDPRRILPGRSLKIPKLL